MNTRADALIMDNLGRRQIVLFVTLIFLMAALSVLGGCNGGDDSDMGPVADSGDPGNPGNSSDSGSTVFECDGSNLTSLQQALLDAHNEARAVDRICEPGGPTLPAVGPLEWNCVLAEAAFNHSQDMATVNFFSHTGSDGLNSADRVINLGYRYLFVGENIAAGQNSVEQVMAGWLDSPGHCMNIMRSEYTELGAAMVESSTADYGTYWTAVFAQPQ